MHVLEDEDRVCCDKFGIVSFEQMQQSIGEHLLSPIIVSRVVGRPYALAPDERDAIAMSWVLLHIQIDVSAWTAAETMCRLIKR